VFVSKVLDNATGELAKIVLEVDELIWLVLVDVLDRVVLVNVLVCVVLVNVVIWLVLVNVLVEVLDRVVLVDVLDWFVLVGVLDPVVLDDANARVELVQVVVVEKECVQVGNTPQRGGAVTPDGTHKNPLGVM
jgi:hypothetical protein